MSGRAGVVWLWASAGVRGVAGALGAFLLLNVAGELVRPPFSVVPEWLGIARSGLCSLGFCTIVAATLLALAAGALQRPALRTLGTLVLGAVATVAAIDVVRFYSALLAGTFETWMPVPASLVVVCTFLLLCWAAWRSAPPAPSAGRGRARFLGVALLSATGVLGALPLVRMVTFGASRYERSADCAVVFGARVWDDGSPSLALADRVDEGVRLYRAGKVKLLLMSGAIDERNHHSEPRVMMQRAVAAGVPPEAILLDEGGIDTASTVRSAGRLVRAAGLRDALVVTHYYHEPRAKMLLDRQGVRAYTIPAHMSRHLGKEPWFLVREVLAWYHSFLFQ